MSWPTGRPSPRRIHTDEERRALAVARVAKWRAENPEKYAAQNARAKQKRDASPEETRLKYKQWHIKNAKQYYANNRDLFKKKRVIQYQRHRDRDRAYNEIYRKNHLLPCRGCEAAMVFCGPSHKAIFCLRCRNFLSWLHGRSAIMHENLPSHLGTFTKGDVDKWSNEITRQKAIKQLQKLLNSQKATQLSQISEKNR